MTVIDKLNESKFSRDSWIEYKVVFKSTLSLALLPLLRKLPKFIQIQLDSGA